MKHGVYILIILMALLSLSESGYARILPLIVPRDTVCQVVVYYEEKGASVDLSYKGNNQSIALLDSVFGKREEAKNVIVQDIVSLVSPDGEEANDSSLSVRRTSSVREFLRSRYPFVDLEKTELIYKGENWSEFRKMVEADPDLPNREEVVMLMDYHWNDKTKLKQLLRKLDRGISQRYIVRKVFPQLRRSLITLVREVPDARIKTLEPVSSVSELFVSEREEALPQNQLKKTDEKQSCEVTVSETEEPVKSETVLAIKNNLLYDLALAPNLEVEIPIGRKWSLNTEFKCPWWLNNDKDYCYQLLTGGVESRYWLGDRKKRDHLTGHFVGLYAEGGKFDFQFGGDGCQGKYYAAAGLSYGYTRRLARHFALEFSLGVGYLTTEYNKYTPYEGNLIRTKSGRYNFIGPTKAKISLVWLITTRR